MPVWVFFMKIIQKIAKKATDIQNTEIPTIAFFGDSVTQGCFELQMKNENSVEAVCDKNCAYHNYIAKIFTVLFPRVPVNIINAGISGDSAPNGARRLERDVLRHNPDLTVVCFGLNDTGGGMDGIGLYTDALRDIFKRLKENGGEVIFMTPNMMNQYVSPRIEKELIKNIVADTANRQNEGVMTAYVDAAKSVCEEEDIIICDCYEKWMLMSESGVDVTRLLSNEINHPTREMNWLFATMLVNTMFEK